MSIKLKKYGLLATLLFAIGGFQDISCAAEVEGEVLETAAQAPRTRRVSRPTQRRQTQQRRPTQRKTTAAKPRRVATRPSAGASVLTGVALNAKITELENRLSQVMAQQNEAMVLTDDRGVGHYGKMMIDNPEFLAKRLALLKAHIDEAKASLALMQLGSTYAKDMLKAVTTPATVPVAEQPVAAPAETLSVEAIKQGIQDRINAIVNSRELDKQAQEAQLADLRDAVELEMGMEQSLAARADALKEYKAGMRNIARERAKRRPSGTRQGRGGKRPSTVPEAPAFTPALEAQLMFDNAFKDIVTNAEMSPQDKVAALQDLGEKVNASADIGGDFVDNLVMRIQDAVQESALAISDISTLNADLQLIVLPIKLRSIWNDLLAQPNPWYRKLAIMNDQTDAYRKMLPQERAELLSDYDALVDDMMQNVVRQGLLEQQKSEGAREVEKVLTERYAKAIENIKRQVDAGSKARMIGDLKDLFLLEQQYAVDNLVTLYRQYSANIDRDTAEELVVFDWSKINRQLRADLKKVNSVDAMRQFLTNIEKNVDQVTDQDLAQAYLGYIQSSAVSKKVDSFNNGDLQMQHGLLITKASKVFERLGGTIAPRGGGRRLGGDLAGPVMADVKQQFDQPLQALAEGAKQPAANQNNINNQLTLWAKSVASQSLAAIQGVKLEEQEIILGAYRQYWDDIKSTFDAASKSDPTLAGVYNEVSAEFEKYIQNARQDAARAELDSVWPLELGRLTAAIVTVNQLSDASDKIAELMRQIAAQNAKIQSIMQNGWLNTLTPENKIVVLGRVKQLWEQNLKATVQQLSNSKLNESYDELIQLIDTQIEELEKMARQTPAQ